LGVSNDAFVSNSYFELPPRFQILHCIRNRVRGGSSVFVDAFAQALHLSRREPTLFEFLATHKVNFQYINDEYTYHYSHPTIELDASPTCNLMPIRYINYSPPFQSPLPLDTPKTFWEAINSFASYLDCSSARYQYLLQEGDAVLFDNRRILHGREAFEEINLEADTVHQSNRWLKGCYLNGITPFQISNGRCLTPWLRSR
jgi:gamma-butyrobetaine dioxygenase